MKFLKAGLVVSLFLLLGRLSGFARDWFLGWHYGAGLESDLAILVLTVPDLVVGIVLGGGVAVALVPEFRRLSPSRAAGLLLQALGGVTVALALVALIVAVFSRDLMGFLGPGLPISAIEQGQWYFVVALIAIPLTAGSGVVAAWLDAHGKFQFSSSGTAIYNLFVIGGMVFLSSFGLLYAVMFGVLAGAFVRFGFQATAAACAVTTRPTFEPIDYVAIGRRFGSAFLFSSVLALLMAIARALATHQDVGALSIFSYAVKVVELPMALAVSAISVVLLPKLALEFQRDTNAAVRSAALALRGVTLICLGLAIPALFFPDSVFRVIFPSEAFSSEQRALMADVFVAGVIFLPARGVADVCISILAAARLTHHLALAAILLLAVFLVAVVVLAPPMGLVGIMLSQSIAMLTVAAYMFVVVSRTLGREVPEIWLSDFLRYYAVPAAGSLLICSVGSAISTNVFTDIVVGLLSFGLFMLVAFGLDKNRWFPPSEVKV